MRSGLRVEPDPPGTGGVDLRPVDRVVASVTEGIEHLKFNTANEVHIPVGRPIEIGLDSDNAMLDDIHSEYEKGVAWKAYPESLTILRTLRDAGYRLGVIFALDVGVYLLLRGLL